MDILYRYLEYLKYVPQGTCRIEWVKLLKLVFNSVQCIYNQRQRVGLSVLLL